MLETTGLYQLIYRRKVLGADQKADFFDPNNEAFAAKRAEGEEILLIKLHSFVSMICSIGSHLEGTSRHLDIHL